ncbi:undecaprenyldiphospho-muramoylpentapeptide beta-N-acetylglucosaminyltransferase [Uliginosibacterium gangwonense]|uniref:undecaprenyldiphospho-muramoylpentapeptide beta-N-acetylglucosaminyltransferase n=1 Tax=Uliginosibacterium gangwonense TaxID=392736 RepID=UPI00036D45F6|nr:undecaprenyldiphospho-muramoylpentapeptide beta-N-acetylglucosaminyltransferase [Uliginosibacterium gangwonense]
MPTLLVMAGGTGGHIYPGVAVAEALRARGWKVAWMGNATGMEGRLVPPLGYECVWIRFGALRGKGLLRMLALPFNLLRGFWQAGCAMRRVKPDVVLGMGGYVSFPGGVMAVLSGRPLVLHEQNSVAGLANRVLAKLARRIVTGFPGVFPKGEWLGNPVRQEIAAIASPEERYAARGDQPLNILVVGGSLGAQALNSVVPQALALLPQEKRPRVVHQAGAKQIDALRQAYADAGVEGTLLDFIEDMAGRYAEADLVICRAGALTVAELAAAGVPSILVPFPHAVDDHQTGNAKFLVDGGAAELIPQPELSPAGLAERLRQLDRASLLERAQKARNLARPEAAKAVADLCQSLCSK